MRHIVKYAEHGTDCGHEGCPHPLKSWCDVEITENDGRFHTVDQMLRHLEEPMVRDEPCIPCFAAVLTVMLDKAPDEVVAAALGADPDFH